MLADPTMQERLLEVQDADTRLTQIAHRQRTLPEIAAANEAAAALATVVLGRLLRGERAPVRQYAGGVVGVLGWFVGVVHPGIVP